jgi:hypothetical protein
VQCLDRVNLRGNVIPAVDMRRLVDGKPFSGHNPRLEGAQHSRQSAADAPQAHDAYRGVVQVARRTANELLLFLRLKEHRQAPQPGQYESQRMVGDLIGRRTIGKLAEFYATDVITVFAPVK